MALAAVRAEHTSWQTGVTTVAARARRAASDHPDKVAMRQKAFGIWSETSWQEMWEQVELASNGLLALGVVPGDRVSIHAEDRREWVVLDLAIVAIRAVTVGLYPTNSAAEVAYMLADCGSVVHLAEDQEQVDKVLDLTDGGLPDLRRIIHLERRGFADYTDKRLLAWEQFLELGRNYRDSHSGELDERMAAAQLDDIMTLVYTPGTTGKPKGAMITNANADFCIRTLVMNSDRMPAGKLPNATDQIVSFLPLCDVTERAFSTWHLASATATLNFAENANEVTTALREVQPTLFFATPGIWERMLGGVTLRAAAASPLKRFTLNRALNAARWIGRNRAANGGAWTFGTRAAYGIGWLVVFRALRERLGLRHCRYAVSGTAPIAPEVLEFFLGIGVDVYEIYGLTESTGVGTANLAGRMQLGTIGEAYPSIADGVRLSEEASEIQLSHDGVFAGYWGRDKETAEAFADDGWLRTGDIGEWVGDTHLRFVERTKDILITSQGANVSPSEIENSLKTSPFIAEAMVVGESREYLTALLSLDATTVAAWARTQGISFTTVRHLTEQEDVLAQVADAVQRTNATVGQPGEIKDFRLIPKELDHEDGELTATHKLKRDAMHTMYGELVESMY